MTPAQNSQMKRYNECFQFKCQSTNLNIFSNQYFNSSITINRTALFSPVDQPSPIDAIPSGPLTDLATPLDDLTRAALGRPSPGLFADSATDLQSPSFNFTSSDQSSNREFPQAVIEDSVQREEPPPKPVPIYVKSPFQLC